MIQNKDAHRRVIAARTKLVLDEPFWGMLSSRLRVVEDPSCETAWTDGVSLGYNPSFILSLTHRQVIALMAHETDHCARGHPWRRGTRDHKKFNVAADLAINGDLRRCGFTLPAAALFPEQYELPEGKSSEWYYDRVPSKGGNGGGHGGQSGAAGQDDGAGAGGAGEQENGGGQSGDDKPDPLGEVRDAPMAVDEAAPTEEGWRQAVVQAAAVAAGQGKLPAGLERLVDSAKRSRIDWIAATIRFAQEIARNDYTWARPNPRYVASGIYLPALRNKEVGIMAVAIDTSGSVDGVLLEQFGGVVQAIAEDVRPREIRVLMADAAVASEYTIQRGEPVVFTSAGGGGTDFRPVFNRIAEWDEPPVCVLYLTDLAGTFPEQDPELPVMWVTGRETELRAPFGEILCAA